MRAIMDDPVIEEIPGGDPELAMLLAEAGLPYGDLAEPGRHFFRFREQGRLIGVIGWEVLDETVALLRSLAVLPAERGRGAGGAMIDWALTRLAEHGVADVYLLTTSIEPLARRQGFAPTGRASAPAVIRHSREFTGLCPKTAVLLHRRVP